MKQGATTERFAERVSGHQPLTWRSWLGIILVPALIGGLLLWAFWRPTQHLDRVTAAIVNQDQPVKVRGQLAPLGRELAGKLVSTRDSNLTWVLTDPDDAAEGLSSARYAAVLTIPAEFSKAATSAATPASAKQAVLNLSSSADSALLDSALSTSVAQAATSVFNSTMAQAHIDNVYLGFSTLRDKLGEAATGAGQLATGSGQLAGGLAQLATGADRLGAGTGQLAGGASGLARGIEQLDAGTGRLAQGADQLAAGQGQLVSGMTRLGSGAAQLSRGNAEFAAGITRLGAGATALGTAGVDLAGGFTRTAAGLSGLAEAASGLQTGGASLTSGLDQLAEGARSLPASARDLAAGADRVASGTAALLAKLKAGGAMPAAELAELEALVAGAQRVAAGNAQLAQGLEPLAAGAAESAAGARRLQEGLSRMAAGVPALTSGAAQLTSGADRFATGAKEFAATTGATTAGAQKLAVAARSLSAGINQSTEGLRRSAAGATSLAGGVRSLDRGTGELAAGARRLASGLEQTDSGVDQLAAGAARLTTGAKQLDLGVDRLASGLTTAASSVPAYTPSERQALATVAATPVATRGLGLGLDDHGPLGFLAVIGLWAGALATYIVLAAVPVSVRSSRRTTVGLLGRSVVGTSALAAIQASLLTAVAWVVGGLSLGTGVALWLALMLAGIAFLLVNAVLAGLFGNLGRLLSATALVVTLVAGLWSGAPAAFTSVLPVLPTDGALRLVRGVLGQGQQSVSGIVALVVWTLVGAALLALVIERRRTVRLAARAGAPSRTGAEAGAGAGAFA